MLGRIAFIARHEAAFFFRLRETYVWAFVMPVLFIYFIGTVTSQFRETNIAGADPIIVNASPSTGFLADQIAARLKDNGLSVERAATTGGTATVSRRVIVPDDFTDSVLHGKQRTITFERKDEGISNDFDRFRVGRAVYTVLADLIACDAAGKRASESAFNEIHLAPHSLTLDVQLAGRRVQPPTGFEQAVPGMMIMFTMISMLSVGSVILVTERRQGRLKRLASTPISRSELLVGKWAGRMVVGAFQMAFAMVIGSVLFGMRWGGSLPMILLVLLAFAALCGWVSILLGNLARSEAQAIGIGVLFTNVTAAVGGLWWPIEICPRWMQTLSGLLPTGWTMHAMHQLVSFKSGPSAAIAPLVALLAASIVVAWLATRTFRYQ